MTTFLFFGVFLLLSGGGDGNCRRTPVSSLSDTVGSFPAFVRDNFYPNNAFQVGKREYSCPVQGRLAGADR